MTLVFEAADKARSALDRDGPRFGPLLRDGKTLFRLYSPSASTAELLIEGRDAIPMERVEDGFLALEIDDAGPGTRYRFRVGDLVFPDLASRQQDGGTAGWSIVREPLQPSGRHAPIRPWHEAVVCEVHIGTATPEGTFAGLMNRLEHFRDAGYTALEIMPANSFPGSRNWGYDGTLIFAPAGAYGTPEELRALVDRAHELGLCLILDVVYNHFGEVDNFVEHYAPEWYDPKVDTPWGPGINTANPMVRQFYYENALMWLGEYDFDGLRFDAVHEIKGEGHNQFLGELAERSCRAKPFARLIVENMKNSFRWLERNDLNQPMTYTAQWNDDMHHVLAYLVTREGKTTGYDDPAKDPYADLEKALADGFVHDSDEGDRSDGRTRGGRAAELPPDCFITYVQNHDQIGNRADLKRIVDRIGPRELDFAHFVKFLAPQVPLCFMGDEANLRTGFPFFVDLEGEAAKRKAERRYKEMREMFNQPEVKDGDLPDPSDPATFESARLRWDDFAKDEHRASLDRFRQLAGIRRDYVWPLAATPCTGATSARQGNCLIVNWMFEAGTLTMALNPAAFPNDIACTVTGHAVSTGDWSQYGEVLRLGPWSAVAWSVRS